MADAAPNVLLICTVGGSPDPIVVSILSDPVPDRVLFVCSKDSRETVARAGAIQRLPEKCPICGEERHSCRDLTGIRARVQERGRALGDGQIDYLTLSDAEDLHACVEQCRREITPRILDWMKRPGRPEVIVDFTGGTKCMSVALGLVSRSWPCRLRYVGGKKRTQGDVGTVIPGQERVVHSQNPWDVLGFQAAEEAVTLMDHGNCGAAAALLETAARRAEALDVKRSLQTLRSLAEAFFLWDAFDHSAAAERLNDVSKNRNDLYAFLSSERVAAVIGYVKRHQPRLSRLASAEEPTEEFVADLVANAGRRIRERRYDDAVARLYRSLEAMAQIRLRTEHEGLSDTGRVSIALIPPELRKLWKIPARQKTMALGLRYAFELLSALGDSLGKRFIDAGLGSEHSPLWLRNRSILAHGFQPIGETACRQLWQAVSRLLDSIPAAEEFPHLGR